jgi:hypothetical protein
MGIVAELVTEDAEGAGRISESAGNIVGGLVVDEKGAEGLVLALEGELGREKEFLVWLGCYLITSTDWHTLMMQSRCFFGGWPVWSQNIKWKAVADQQKQKKERRRARIGLWSGRASEHFSVTHISNLCR